MAAVPFYLKIAFIGDWSPTCSRPRRSFRRRGEIEVEPLFLGVADELLVVGKHAVVAIAQMLENDLACLAEAGRQLEKIDQLLGGQPAGEGFDPYREGYAPAPLGWS
jgi:hypothetical protein